MRQKWLKDQHESQGGLILSVITGGQYGDLDAAKALKTGHVLTTAVLRHIGGLDVVAGDNLQLIGRVRNCSPLTYEQFVEIFIDVFGSEEVVVEVMSTVSVRKDEEGEFGFFRVQVKESPDTRPYRKSTN